MLQYNIDYFTKTKKSIFLDYNLKSFNFKFLESEFISYLKQKNKYLSNRTIQKQIKHLNIIFFDLLQNSSVYSIQRNKEFKDDFAKYTTIPANPNFYNYKTCSKIYEEDHYIPQMMKRLKLTLTNVNSVLAFLKNQNMIDICNGEQREFVLASFDSHSEYLMNDVYNNVTVLSKKPNKTIIKSKDGVFRKVKLKDYKDWNIKVTIIELLETVASIKMCKYANKEKSRYVNKYRDKSLTSDKKSLMIDPVSLKYRKPEKTNDYFEFTKSDYLEMQMRELNSYYINISPILSFTRTFGKDNTQYGRYNSIINSIPKRLRNEVNTYFNTTEELDIKSCVLNTLCLSLCDDWFLDDKTDNDVYSSLLLNIDQIKSNFVMPEDNIYLYGKKINTNEIHNYLTKGDLKYYDTVNNKKYYTNWNLLKQYRPISKQLFMSFFGNNTYTSGTKSILYVLRTLGLYISDDCGNHMYKIMNANNYIRNDYDKADFEKWESYVNDNCSGMIPRYKISLNDVLKAFQKTFSGKYINIRDLLFTNVYPITQNIESSMLTDILYDVKNNNDIITHAHDCIYVKKDKVEYYKNLQNSLLIKYAKAKKQDFYNLKLYYARLNKKNTDFNNVYNTLKDGINSFVKTCINAGATVNINEPDYINKVSDNIKNLSKKTDFVSDFQNNIICKTADLLKSNRSKTIYSYDENTLLNIGNSDDISFGEFLDTIINFKPVNYFFYLSDLLYLNSNSFITNQVKHIYNNITNFFNYILNSNIKLNNMLSYINNFYNYNIKYSLTERLVLFDMRKLRKC